MKPAISLLVGWEEITQRTIKTRKNNYSTISNEDKELHYLAFWYQSGRWRPCLYRHLIGAVNTILLLAIDREKLTEVEVNKWIHGREIYGDRGLPASAIVLDADTSVVMHMLDCALAYWVEAALSHDRNEPELVWQSLLQAQMYIGMAAGPISHRETSARGRDVQHARRHKLATMVLAVLKDFSDRQFDHSKETIDAITSAKPIKDFQEGSEAFNEIEKTLGELRRDNPKIMIEFARVTERPVMRGRPPKSKSLR